MSFKNIFFLREGKVILGKRFINLLVIFVILTATFFALGLSKGSTEYLTKKMKNPFNKWVNFKTTLLSETDKLREVDTVMYYLNNEKDNYQINEIDTMYYDSKEFLKFGYSKLERGSKLEVSYTGTTMYMFTLNQSSQLFSKIISQQLLKSTSLDYKKIAEDFDNTYGIIIKKDLLSKLGYPKNFYPSHLDYTYRLDKLSYVDGSPNIYASVPIIGVVEDLPLNTSFICNYYTHDYLRWSRFYNSSSDCYGFDNENDRPIYFSIPLETNLDDLQRDLGFEIEKMDRNNFLESSFNTSNYYTYNDTIIRLDKICEIINDSYSKNDIHIVEDSKYISDWRDCYDYEYDAIQKIGQPDFVSVSLSNLDSITSLKAYLDTFQSYKNFKNKEKRVINIDISKVENLNNLNFISRLTRLLSIFLLAFSIFSIILFLVNIINTHFEKIKQNIGTLKAFGLSNSHLIRNYILIYISIILSASLVAFVFAAALGELGVANLIFNLLDYSLESGESCFDLLNLNGILAFLSIILISIVVVYFKLRKILLSTPGDLIFER